MAYAPYSPSEVSGIISNVRNRKCKRVRRDANRDLMMMTFLLDSDVRPFLL